MILPLLCAGWIVVGFGVLALFALPAPPRPEIRGLDGYPSAFIGDSLPLVVGVLSLIQERSSGVRVPWRD